jgi:hypothetical protein
MTGVQEKASVAMTEAAGVAATAASRAEPAHQTETRDPKDQKSEDDDPNECGWCRWMKGGECRSQFEVHQDAYMLCSCLLLWPVCYFARRRRSHSLF